MLGLLITSFAFAELGINNASSSMAIYLEAPSIVDVCENFNVSIKVADAVDMWSWQATLQWDPALMELVDVVEGDFLKAGGATLNYSIAESGSMELGFAIYSGHSVSGNGKLADVVLHCIGPGNSTVVLGYTAWGSESQPWNGYGDANSDGTIDIFDAVIVASTYGLFVGNPQYDSRADFNSDGFVDNFDIMCVVLNFARQVPDSILVPVESAPVLVSTPINQSAPAIYCEAPSTVNVCENFTVSIKVANVTNLWGWQVRLQWDPALMEFVNAVEGDFLMTAGETGFSFAPDSDGWIWLADYLTSTLDGVNGTGTLANVTLHCTGPGESALTLLDTRLFTGAQTVLWNGYGDANGDGKVDIHDLAIVSSAIFTSTGDPGYNPAADFNSDGLVNWFDMMCVRLNYGRMFPGDILIPLESAHSTMDEWMSQRVTVTWRWVYLSEDFWYTAYIGFDTDDLVKDFSYTQPQDYISFSITAADPGYCNVTFPKLFMSGAFQVLLNDTLTPSILTWNRTSTSVYFAYAAGTHNIKIRGEIATRLRGLWSLSDINGDGIVDIFDIVRVALDMGWQEP